jgi:hypothetical protein
MHREIEVTIEKIAKPQVEISLAGPRGPKGDRGDNAAISKTNLFSGSAFLSVEDVDKVYAGSTYGLSDYNITNTLNGNRIPLYLQNNFIQCPVETTKFTFVGSYTKTGYENSEFKSILYLVKENDGEYASNNISLYQGQVESAQAAVDSLNQINTEYSVNISDGNQAIIDITSANNTLQYWSDLVDSYSYVSDWNSTNEYVEVISALVLPYLLANPSYSYNEDNPNHILTLINVDMSQLGASIVQLNQYIVNEESSLADKEEIIASELENINLYDSNVMIFSSTIEAYENAYLGYENGSHSWYTDLASQISTINNSMALEVYLESFADPAINTATSLVSLQNFILDTIELHAVNSANSTMVTDLITEMDNNSMFSSTQTSYTTQEIITLINSLTSGWGSWASGLSYNISQYIDALTDYQNIPTLESDIANLLALTATSYGVITTANTGIDLNNQYLTQYNDQLVEESELLTAYQSIFYELESSFYAAQTAIISFSELYELSNPQGLTSLFLSVVPDGSVSFSDIETANNELNIAQESLNQLLVWNTSVYNNPQEAVNAIGSQVYMWTNVVNNYESSIAILNSDLQLAQDNLAYEEGNITQYEVVPVAEFTFTPNSSDGSLGGVIGAVEISLEDLGFNPVYNTINSRFLIGWQASDTEQYKLSYTLTAN